MSIKLFHLYCEWDFGGNLTSNSGVYLSEESARTALAYGLKGYFHGLEFSDLKQNEDWDIEEIEIE